MLGVEKNTDRIIIRMRTPMVILYVDRIIVNIKTPLYFKTLVYRCGEGVRCEHSSRLKTYSIKEKIN
jgi:hypothetical protein